MKWLSFCSPFRACLRVLFVQEVLDILYRDLLNENGLLGSTKQKEKKKIKETHLYREKHTRCSLYKNGQDLMDIQ